MHVRSGCTRRDFFRASCAAWVTLAGTGPAGAGRLWAARHQKKIVTEEPWGRIEELADGVWALVSTPLQDRRTLSNGAILAGRSRVVVIEAFGSTEGAAWLAAWARKLTGRAVDDVIVTHYHADHTAGISAFAGAGERPASLRGTETTLDAIKQDDVRRNRSADAARNELLISARRFDLTAPASIDLGGRTIHVIPRSGHTASDVSIELDDPRIVIAGDLIWNRMFPNFVDAKPSELARSVWALGNTPAQTYVPGHGPLADHAEYQRYVELLNLVETAARAANERGLPVAEAAKQFTLPASLGEWHMFSPRYFEVAFNAWDKELRGTGTPRS
ncbi:MAG TPA: MBL fold metallo-hydrolase [Longimicrobiales bacterium]|nr:MBL fold metallo-hydrolase [Longimicrobiales bacterium]